MPWISMDDKPDNCQNQQINQHYRKPPGWRESQSNGQHSSALWPYWLEEVFGDDRWWSCPYTQQRTHTHSIVFAFSENRLTPQVHQDIPPGPNHQELTGWPLRQMMTCPTASRNLLRDCQSQETACCTHSEGAVPQSWAVPHKAHLENTSCSGCGQTELRVLCTLILCPGISSTWAFTCNVLTWENWDS